MTGDWAAFMQASVVQPEAPATAALSHDSSWDAFQSSDAAAPASTQASAAAPFDPFGESQTIEAAPAGQRQQGVVGQPQQVLLDQAQNTHPRDLLMTS